MERLKSITIIFLLAVGLLASAAPAKSASVLLQEGLYAEEIEGDLDAAIKIYEQVIAQAKEMQRVAAQATYRIGMCYLKKGEKTNAVTQFGNLVSKFPDQKALIAKAQRQLAKLKPPASGFGPAEPVPVEQLIKSGKVPYFEVQLHDNTALDLDSGEILALKDEWPDRFDIAWDNDGGGVLMKKAGSGVRFLALPSGGKQRWDDAICMARSDIDILRNSNTRGIWASRGKFAAVLTNEGNLAVIQIGEYNPEQGTIYGWIEKISTVVFGPVIERIIHSEETGRPFFFDLDTAKAFSPPPGLTRYSPEREVIEWVATKGIDFVNSRGHLELVEMTTVKVESDMWESATPAEIKDALLKGSTQNFLPTRSKDYTISSPITYVFKTREGGIGILQVLEKKNQNLRIRYKMLQERAKIASVEVFGPVIERVIYDHASSREHFIDFESGEIFKIPEPLRDPNISQARAIEWLTATGIDAEGDTGGSPRSHGLVGFPPYNAAAVEAPGGWNATPETLIAMTRQLTAGGKSKMFAKDPLPTTYYFKTRQGNMGVLQILGFTVGDPRGVKFRYKMLQKESAGRIVFLPDADDVIQQGKVAVVLDLTTGKMLPGNKDKQYFNKLNKGDVAYFDDEGKDLLVCFRGAKITRKTANGKYYDTPDQSHTDNTTHIYIIKKTPAEWTITTKEGDIYELKVLSLDNNLAQIKYRKMPALEKKTSIDEKLRSAFIACGTLCDSIRNALDDDDFETAEALCKEVEKHLAKGLELIPQSELGPMYESLAVQFKIWHEAIKAKDKEKAIRLGEALNHAGGLISDFVLEEKPDTHK